MSKIAALADLSKNALIEAIVAARMPSRTSTPEHYQHYKSRPDSRTGRPVEGNASAFRGVWSKMKGIEEFMANARRRQLEKRTLAAINPEATTADVKADEGCAITMHITFNSIALLTHFQVRDLTMLLATPDWPRDSANSVRRRQLRWAGHRWMAHVDSLTSAQEVNTPTAATVSPSGRGKG